jgi:outer membrane receptor protein involved in Fe transport
LDQTDVEFAGQIFDMNYLVTDGFDVTYVHENTYWADRLTLEGWYNQTRFEGDNLRPGKRNQVPLLDGFLFGFGSLFGRTEVDAMSTGFRFGLTWGEPTDAHVTAGVDLRYLKQQLNEWDVIVGLPPLPPPFDMPPFNGETANKPIPKSHSSNPGLFVQSSLPVTDRWVLRSGARVDWVSTNADQSVPGTAVTDPGLVRVPHRRIPSISPLDCLRRGWTRDAGTDDDRVVRGSAVLGRHAPVSV